MWESPGRRETEADQIAVKAACRGAAGGVRGVLVKQLQREMTMQCVYFTHGRTNMRAVRRSLSTPAE